MLEQEGLPGALPGVGKRGGTRDVAAVASFRAAPLYIPVCHLAGSLALCPHGMAAGFGRTQAVVGVMPRSM